ncbi:MAG TPA: peptidylprolyl isomerase [Bryobacteraceae bacterium]|jgi:peptidyl-prolyl cis-trans isomerase SurA|nr:peptidylprolyl isomerase [Bryobacteraceae bacterium]
MPRTLVVLIVVFALASACSRSAPANVAATVNGRAITYAELEKQYQSQFAAPTERASDDQTEIQKLEVLRTLVDGEIMLQRAERQGLMATDADVEAKFNELKAPYTQEEFQRQLNARKLTAEDLKAQLRRDLSVAKLFNKEITSQISIIDKDITDFYQSNKASFNLAEPQIHLAQILVTPAPDPNVRNLKNDKAQDDDQAKKKIENIYARLRQGEDFAQIAQNYSEDPNSSQNGGDLGFIAESALEKANVDLRKAVMALRPNEITPVQRTAEGYRILKLVTREPAGQRDLADPKVQQTIRETLINRKDQLLKAAYYEVARNEAKVINYFATRIVGNREKK